MPLFEILVVCVAAIAIAGLAGLLSYGSLARRAMGANSAALPVATDDTLLDREVVALLKDRPGSTGLLLLSDNLQAFEMRVQLARSAERSLDLQYYYWLGDLTGNLLAREVVVAADRGVRVRLLIDDINTRGNDSDYLALDSHPNIEIRLFNPSRNRANGIRRGLELALRAFRTTRRMHNKAWIADGRVAIVGGRNVGDAYFDAARATNFHDMDLLFIGEGLSAAQTIFDDFWNSPVAIPINALSRPVARTLPITRVGPRPRRLDAEPYLQRLSKISRSIDVPAFVDQLHWSDDVEVLSDPPEKAWAVRKKSWLVARIYRVIKKARQELKIVSPYFIPGKKGVDVLSRLTAGGTAVTVLTNSLAATDVVAVHGAYASYRKPLLRNGVELFELRPDMIPDKASLFGSKGASLHTKAFTVDDRIGFIGSFNFDPRSASLNTEMGVLFSQPELVDRMNAIIRKQTASTSAFRVTLIDDRLAWNAGADPTGEATSTEPSANVGRRLAAAIVGLLPIESQL
jgi:putative cardiolipin synthase